MIFGGHVEFGGHFGYCKTRIFSVDKFSSKHCQRAFATSIFRECVNVKNINKSIKMLLEMHLPHK